MELKFHKGPESSFRNGKSSECVCCGDRQLNKKAKATRPPIQKAGISGVIQATRSLLFRRRIQLCQKISDKAENTWRPSSHLHIFSRQAQSSATLSQLFRRRVQLCQKEPHLHYHVSFRKRRGVVQKSKGRLLRNRRGVFKDRRGATISKSRICGIKTFVDKGKRYHHLILSLYMSTFVFYGKANLKNHAQLSLTSEGALPAKPFEILNSFFFPKDDTRCLEYI